MYADVSVIARIVSLRNRSALWCFMLWPASWATHEPPHVGGVLIASDQQNRLTIDKVTIALLIQGVMLLEFEAVNFGL